MSIMITDYFGINFTQPQSTGLSMQMAQTKPSQPMPDVPRNPVRDEPLLPVSDNMLAGNFVQQGFQERSRYVNGIMAGLEVQNSFMSQMQSVVAGYAHVRDLTPGMTNAEKNLLGKKAAEDIKRVVDDEVKKEVGEEIEAMTDEIEEKADEAAASESEKMMENQTSPQEELEKSLEETEPVAQAEDADQKAEKLKAAEQKTPEEPITATEQETTAEIPTTSTLDIIV